MTDMTPIPHTDQLTAQSWMLFSDMDGVNQAARELTYALEMALTCDNRAQAWAIVDPVRERFAVFGAIDSEPRRVVDAYLDIWFPEAGRCNFRLDRDAFQVPFV
jgi:hypothetical protein